MKALLKRIGTGLARRAIVAWGWERWFASPIEQAYDETDAEYARRVLHHFREYPP